ncbi:MAG: hypothetical protein KAS12_06020 [Candidatus Aenigmarchaeota archaeon]|nr:hypothetical protein [Candidatus Aenigmarchaeota archaeon]
MVDAIKQEKESVRKMLQRFSGYLRRSNKLFDAKKRRFYRKPDNKHQVKRSTLYRKRQGERINFLVRSGQMKEEDANKRKRRH